MTSEEELKKIIDQDQDYLNKFHEDQLLEKIKNITSEGTSEIEDKRITRITRTILWTAKLLTSIFKRDRMRSDEIIDLTRELNDLSKKSEAQTKKLISLTRWLIIWTVILAILTLTLLLRDIGVFPKNNKQINSGTHNTQKSDKN
jgi:hypothetical protein